MPTAERAARHCARYAGASYLRVDDGVIDRRAIHWVVVEGVRAQLRPHEQRIAVPWMHARGLNDSAIAERLGITTRTVQRLLHGRGEGKGAR